MHIVRGLALTHSHTHTYTHTLTHSLTHSHTHTHTHTHRYASYTHFTEANMSFTQSRGQRQYKRIINFFFFFLYSLLKLQFFHLFQFPSSLHFCHCSTDVVTARPLLSLSSSLFPAREIIIITQLVLHMGLKFAGHQIQRLVAIFVVGDLTLLWDLKSALKGGDLRLRPFRCTSVPYLVFALLQNS
jgi:hypothetical protein